MLGNLTISLSLHMHKTGQKYFSKNYKIKKPAVVNTQAFFIKS